ncbi:uncharacterized protein LOC127859309 isoform X2 [Dreissena polymorpha]|uniref:Uncharacterized protein n=1 Tax=Dreissena polymorpha TaxID=45954 RepID=A0A9D3YFB6_DREPO|nr:uncharacterized protein LOC127859309 isoform X2 [Dreissena polymorpha]KAH3699637.1 hypothetical protein DPMN_074596 [Dreissena polymorpha]
MSRSVSEMQDDLQKNKVLTGLFGVTSLVLLIFSVVEKYSVYATLTNYTVCVGNGVLGLLMTLLMTYIVVRTGQLSESNYVYYFRSCLLGALFGANVYGTGFAAAGVMSPNAHTPNIALSVIIAVTCVIMLIGTCVVTVLTLFRGDASQK